jgi:putative membrane protein
MSHMHPIRGMAAGVLAGLAASWVMNQFQQMRPESRRDQQGNGKSQRDPQEHKVEQSSDNEPATVKTAELVSQRVFEHDLSPQEKQVAGPAVHYAYGAVVGGLYGGLAELLPGVGAGLGLPFGFALWLLGDEVAVPALGLAKPPLEYPPEVHADALAAHFMYGATTDLLRRVVKHVI